MAGKRERKKDRQKIKQKNEQRKEQKKKKKDIYTHYNQSAHTHFTDKFQTTDIPFCWQTTFESVSISLMARAVAV